MIRVCGATTAGMIALLLEDSTRAGDRGGTPSLGFVVDIGPHWIDHGICRISSTHTFARLMKMWNYIPPDHATVSALKIRLALVGDD